MAIQRLSGGLSPADGADPRTFPQIWNAAAGEIEAQGTAISGVQSDVDTLQSDVTANGTAITALQADSIPTEVSSPVAGQKLVFDGTNWVNLEGYVYVDTLYFTSNGTFTKASYPWLRAIRVKCVGGGAAGGGPTTGFPAGGAGGGGAAYAESFITDIASLPSSVAVTRGAGEAGSTGVRSGGGQSSFGATLVAANGGPGEPGPETGGAGAFVGTGDIVIAGQGGGQGSFGSTANGSGGSSFLGGGARGTNNFPTNAGGVSAIGNAYGAGGNGSRCQSTANNGGSGGNGIVIVELFA